MTKNTKGAALRKAQALRANLRRRKVAGQEIDGEGATNGDTKHGPSDQTAAETSDSPKK